MARDVRGVGDARRLLGEHPGDRGEPAGVQVVQDDVGDAALAAVPQQRPVHERDPESAAAENGQPHHLAITFTPASRREAPRRRVRGRVRHHHVQVARARRPWPCPCRGTCRVGEQDDLVAAADHGSFDRDLDDGGVHHLPAGADAAGAEEEPVGMELAEVVLGQEADQRAVLAPDHPAEEHQLDALVVLASSSSTARLLVITVRRRPCSCRASR